MGARTALINIGLLATPQGLSARGGGAQSEVQLLQDAYLLMADGLVERVGSGSPSRFDLAGHEVIDARGALVTPGLVDAHTHLVFGGWRAHELQLKLAGVPYLDILDKGGGILDTVRQTRKASTGALVDKARQALDGMLALGTTTVEAKSGYGLDLDNEIKQLEAVKQLQETHPVDLVSTLMAAHALPPEYKEDREGFLRLIIDTIIPEVAGRGLAEFCDVFCEQGVFTVTESRRVLEAAARHGLRAKIHADELHAIGGSELAGELGAVSAEHLIAMRDSGIAALKTGGVIACLLPATSFYLHKPYARARDLVTAGVPIALGSDFNPGSCPGYSLQLCMNLASWHYKLSPQEILTAVTLNGAAAIGRARQTGSLEPGKLADAVIWEADSLDFLCYRFGSNLARAVIKKGRLVAGA
ncbi:MAG: imidazolonepropionase [Clostridiales bacterium]|nr:imidazolonepropionase [Clostridiales bacterium]